jgi:hypothetical protein
VVIDALAQSREHRAALVAQAAQAAAQALLLADALEAQAAHEALLLTPLAALKQLWQDENPNDEKPTGHKGYKATWVNAIIASRE